MTVLVLQALMRIRCHPAFAAVPAIGSPGYAMPRIDRPLIVAAEPQNLQLLRERGIAIEGAAGDACLIVMDEAMPRLDLTLRFHGHDDCAVILGIGDSFAGRLEFNGPHGLFVSAGFGASASGTRLAVILDTACAVFFGSGVTATDSFWQVEGDAAAPRAVMLGDDAMVGRAVACTNSEGHAMIDISTLTVVHGPGDVVLGPHCRLGDGARIAGPAKIGAGSIIAPGAIVTEDVPDTVLAGGVPARTLREGVTWDRRRRPSAEEVRALLDRL